MVGSFIFHGDLFENDANNVVWKYCSELVFIYLNLSSIPQSQFLRPWARKLLCLKNTPSFNALQSMLTGILKSPPETSFLTEYS